MTRQQRTVLFKCENLKMREREKEELCARLFLVCVCAVIFSLLRFRGTTIHRYVHGKLLLLLVTYM
jgi:hypothetical protein